MQRLDAYHERANGEQERESSRPRLELWGHYKRDSPNRMLLTNGKRWIQRQITYHERANGEQEREALAVVRVAVEV
jgi:hypothetical protein